MGSIPACTGEPDGRRVSHRGNGVYPRVYGGTYTGLMLSTVHIGLSPRVRGNPPFIFAISFDLRSIPACTGEPSEATYQRKSCQVYPRVYGGTRDQSPPVLRAGGLSPRVRGNPGGSSTSWAAARSIPACTGEPWAGPVFCSGSGVYPRVYGGTRDQSPPVLRAGGLSPRVRGNLAPQTERPGPDGSIPACTGEPMKKGKGYVPSKVYPRVYGGTTWMPPSSDGVTGLSPRVRGNPEIW